MRTQFKFPIGDWSGDGHEKCDYFLMSAAKGNDAIIAAFERSVRLMPEYDPRSFCCEYEDDHIPEHIEEKLKEIPEVAGNWYSYEVKGDIYWAFDEPSKGMAQYVVWFINQGDPDLDVKLEAENDVPMIHLPHNGNTSFVGYGLFW